MKLIPKNWASFQHYKDRNPPWIRLHKALLDNRDFISLSPMACKVLVLIWLVASDTVEGVLNGDIEDLAFRLRLPVDDVDKALQTLLEKGFLLYDESSIENTPNKPVSQQIAQENGFGSRHISDITKRAVWERDEAKCRSCDSMENIEYDHIQPVSKGGNSELGNIQLLCRACNRKKRVKIVGQVATHAQTSLRLRTTETETETETETDNGFALFWSTYPNTQRKQSKGKCEDVWKKGKFHVDKQKIQSHVESLKTSPDWLKSEGQYIPAPLVYLNQKRWDGVETINRVSDLMAGAI